MRRYPNPCVIVQIIVESLISFPQWIFFLTMEKIETSLTEKEVNMDMFPGVAGRAVVSLDNRK